MKRVVFFLIVFIGVASAIFAQENKNSQHKWLGRSRFGCQVFGKHEITLWGLPGTADVNFGVSFGAEFLYSLHKNIELGAGLEYQFDREQKSIPGGFSFSPIYAVIRIPYNLETIEPYAIGRIGYNFFFGDAQYMGTGIYYMDPRGGLYYSFGAGISVPGLSFNLFNSLYRLFIEANYSVNNGSGEFLGDPVSVTYSKVDLFIGVESRY